jgi:predicted dehydrogenase
MVSLSSSKLDYLNLTTLNPIFKIFLTLIIMTQMKRRKFLATTAAAAGITLIPRHVLGGVNYIAPSDKLNVACIGTGTQGTRVLLQLLKLPDLQITSVADPVKEDTRYQNWGKFELRDGIREAINEPNWDKGIDGCRAGRIPAQQIINKWYSKQAGLNYKGCNAYEDFRELLEKENIDAVIVATPDHNHAQVSIKSLLKGKHVFCQKPMSNSIYESRLMADTAKKSGLSTQVATGNASSEDTDLLCEMIWSGAIGAVREVHNWSNRPVWQSGFTKLPAEEKVPKGFNWDLWLGRSEFRPFSYDYTHTVFRSWYDFGTGALGDMGCYSFAVIYRALKLGFCSTAEASANTAVGVVDGNPAGMPYVSHPLSMTAHFTFPSRAGMPPVDLFWYDGGIRPALPKELEADGKELDHEGLLFVGDYGKIICGFQGHKPRLIPDSLNKSYIKPPQMIERSKGHYEDWIQACKGGAPARCTFNSADPITETLCLGILAMRTGKKLSWDPEKLLTNSEDANKLIKPFYRPGWEL